MKFPYRLKQLILLAGDAVCFGLGLWLALAARNFSVPGPDLIQSHLNLGLWLFLLWIVINYINGLYDLGSAAGYRRITEAAVSAFLISMVLLYLVPQTRLTPKTILLLNVGFGYFLSALWRTGFNNVLGHKKLTTRVILVGFSKEIQELMNIIEAHPEKGYEVVAICDPEQTIKSHDLRTKAAVYHSLRALRPAITTHRGHIIVTAPHMRDKEHILRELYELLFWPVQIMDYSSLYEITTGRISPATFSESWFLNNLSNHRQHIYSNARRALDYIISLIMGGVCVVLFPLIALATKLSSPGPILFKQKRIGQFGRIFTIYKFRTMYALAPDGSAEIGKAEFAQKKDKRITNVGSLLRKTRLDELPQFVNLFRGDVTLIGPRPERPEIVERLTADMPYYPLRHIIKPGITGWAAIHQHYTDTFKTSLEKLEYDLYYIKNRSLVLDLIIALRTINVVMRMMGQ